MLGTRSPGRAVLSFGIYIFLCLNIYGKYRDTLLLYFYFIGIATDGPLEGFEHDIDYQSDTNTVTMRFSGFESSLHGISAFDWSIGTRPDCEDVTPFMEHGIVHNEEDGVPGHGEELCIFYQYFEAPIALSLM